jgi:hypothetical protein
MTWHDIGFGVMLIVNGDEEAAKSFFEGYTDTEKVVIRAITALFERKTEKTLIAYRERDESPIGWKEETGRSRGKSTPQAVESPHTNNNALTGYFILSGPFLWVTEEVCLPVTIKR